MYKWETNMNPEEFKASIEHAEPPARLSAPLWALWWDAKGHWNRSHALVETLEGMAVAASPTVNYAIYFTFPAQCCHRELIHTKGEQSLKTPLAENT
jgi:hypothetical protein